MSDNIIFVYLYLTSLHIIIYRSIYVPANDIISFFFMAEQYYIDIFTNSSLPIPLPMDIQCIHVLAVVNSASVNTGVHVSFQIIVFSGYMYVQEWDSWIIQQFYCLGFFREPPQWLYQFTFPLTVQVGSVFYTPSSAFVSRLFHDGHSNQYEVMILHCNSDLHFSNNQ